MTAPNTENTTTSISFDGPIFAINERSPEGIPAVELDTTIGQRVVLIFTSLPAAKKYCYLRRPEATPNIIELTRKTTDNVVIQSGLIKIARVVRRDHPEITAFCIDHPGSSGAAHYLTVDDVAFLGQKKVETEDNFESALDDALGETK